MSFSPDGRHLASVAAAEDRVRLWDVQTGRELRGFRITPRSHAYSVAFSPDGSALAVGLQEYGDGNGEAQMFDTGNGQRLRRFPLLQRSAVYSVAFSPDGKTLAGAVYVYPDGAIRLWRTDNGALEHSLTVQKSNVYRVAFSPDGSVLASSGADGLRLWDWRAGRLIRALAPLKGFGAGRGLAVSPDGRTIATGTGELSDPATPEGEALLARIRNGAPIPEVQVWSASTGQPGRLLYAPFAETVCLAFSPDGLTLARGGGTGSIQLWNLKNGQLVETITDSARVDDLCFSPDGRMLATGNHGGLLRLWTLKRNGDPE